MKTLGIDIGGTHISCATVVTKDDTLIAEQVVRHHVDSAGNAETVFKAWAKAIRDHNYPDVPSCHRNSYAGTIRLSPRCEPHHWAAQV